jgi:hypothetical protein
VLGGNDAPAFDAAISGGGNGGNGGNYAFGDPTRHPVSDQ